MANNLIVCGGTFDHFHQGHESFLRYTFSLGKNVIVGITSDEFVRRWKIDDRSWKQIEPFEKRRQAVLGFIKKEKVLNLNKIEIIKIEDLFGPALSKNLPIDAIVVSEETKRGAGMINKKRKELGLKDLKILVAPSVYAQDKKLISSERIRNGEISRAGKLYIDPLWLKKDLVLPERLRGKFKKPFGALDFDVSKHQNQFTWIASVGDVATKKLNQMSVNQKVSVIDFKVAREKKFSNILELGFSGSEKIFRADNPAGHITSDLFKKLTEILKSNMTEKMILQINGEDDLAVLPLILLSPLNAVIYYGQPNQGIVRVEVSEENKRIAYELVDRFEILKPSQTR